jgi:hypothetical protein
MLSHSPLHPWDEANLVMVNDLSVVVFGLPLLYRGFLHQCSLRRLAFLDVSLSGFGMNIILAS